MIFTLNVYFLINKHFLNSSVLISIIMNIDRHDTYKQKLFEVLNKF